MHGPRQDYSSEPPSSTDKRVATHPALRVGTQTRDGESLPSGLLVRQAFPGGTVHFDNQQSVCITDNRDIESQPKDSASQNANPGMPACGKAGKWGLARKSGFSNA
jgi:hypothetical protein